MQHWACALPFAACRVQVPAYLRRNKQTVVSEKQQLEEYIKLREQPVSGETDAYLAATMGCTRVFCLIQAIAQQLQHGMLVVST